MRLLRWRKVLERTNGATITDNYIHDNENVGVWADTDNSGINISGNYISNNYAEGVMYEISYNSLITDNTFIRQRLGAWPAESRFPDRAIYISESGSDSREHQPVVHRVLLDHRQRLDRQLVGRRAVGELQPVLRTGSARTTREACARWSPRRSPPHRLA